MHCCHQLALTACFALVSATTYADPFYWTDPSISPGSNLIRQANGDGSGVSTVVTGLQEPRGMALDLMNGQMYWADPGASAIRRTNIDGSGPLQTVAASGDGSADVALDVGNGKIYWTDSDNTQVNNGGLSGQIRRSNLDGSNVENLVSGLRNPAGIVIDPTSGRVYWTELERKSDGLGSIQSANLDGSDVQILLTGVDEANGLAIDVTHGKLYWPELTTHSIQSANLDGTGLQTVLSGLDNPTTIDLSVSEGKLYWTDSLGQQVSGIFRASFDGSDVETLVSGVGVPWGIAHGNRILFCGETEENAFQGVGVEAGAVAFAADCVFEGSVR